MELVFELVIPMALVMANVKFKNVKVIMLEMPKLKIANQSLVLQIAINQKLAKLSMEAGLRFVDKTPHGPPVIFHIVMTATPKPEISV